KDFFVRLWQRFTKGQSGFTLAELIVVVAIIVGLAAVILPNVGRFTDRGAQGSLATERNSVQTALDTFLAEQLARDPLYQLPVSPTFQKFDYVDPNNASRTIDLIAGGYLRLANGATETAQVYCWTAQGTISSVSIDA